MNTNKNPHASHSTLRNSIEPPTRTLREAREELERVMVERSLKKHGWKITPAAAELGISRPTFYQLIKKLGVTRYPQ